MVDSSSSADWTTEDFNQTLVETGKTLLDPYDTVDELLNRLDNLDHLLRFVGQDQSAAMEEVLKPSKNALILDELLRNDNLDVKVSVLCCITEIARITAPVEPYGDDKMRDIFQVLIMIFSKLPSITGRSYSKAITIINNFARCQLCLLMWDCDDTLIVEMFQIFLHTVHSTARAKHPASVITDMERIMTIMINDDEEDVPVELFGILLDTLKRENKIVSPLSYRMAERVFSNCAVKLKRHLSTAVRLTDVNLDDYAEIVARVCNDTEEVAPDDNDASEEVRPSLCAPSDSLLNNDAASIRDGDTLKNGICAQTLQILEIKHQEVSVAETASADAIRELQGLEANAVRSPKTNEESLKDETASGVLKVCDKKITNEACGSQTDDPEARKTVQEESNSEAVSTLKVNVDISASLNACKQINKQRISEAPNCSQTEDPDAEKTIQEESNTEAVLDLEVNVDTSRLKACNQIKRKNVYDATCSLSEDPDSGKMVQETSNAEPVSALKINEENLEDGNDSALLQCRDQIKLQKTSDTRTNAGPSNSEGATLVRRHSDPRADSISKKRGRKPNSLIKPEEGYDLSWICGDRKSPYVPRRRRNYRKEIGSPSRSSVSKRSSLPSEPARDTQSQSASETRGRSLNKKCPAKGKPRNEDNMSKVDGDLLLLSDSERDLKRSSSVENASSYGAVTKLNLLKLNLSDGATNEHIRRKSRLATLASCSTPNTSTQDFDEEGNTAKHKRKHTPVEEEVSGLRQAVKDNGEKLVGLEVQVFWPIDKKFYKGSVTSFDILTKKHKVTYDDGDEETLDLTLERWELVKDENSSDNGQMSAIGGAALYNRSNNPTVNSSRPPAKKHKGSNIVSSDHVPTSTGQKLKTAGSKSKLDWGKARDPATSATSKMKLASSKPEDRTDSKSLQLMEGKKLLAESIKASPRSSLQFRKKVNVHGYLVKPSRARILEAIIAKYGDIASGCLYKSQTVRASLLEVVCNVLQRLKSSNVTASDIKAMMYEISDAAEAKLEVSWLQQYLAEIIEEEQAAKRSSEVRMNTCLVMKAAKKDVAQRHTEFVEAKKQLKKAKRCVEVLKHVSEKIDNDIWESVAKEKSWQKRMDELL